MKLCSRNLLLTVFLLTACGSHENANLAGIDSPKKLAGPQEGELGIGNRSSMNAGAIVEAYGPVIIPVGRDQAMNSYVRFKKANGLECSGTLAYELDPANEGAFSDPARPVDVYLYTARHCFEESDPFGRPKSTDNTIVESYVYATVPIVVGGFFQQVSETKPVKTKLFSEPALISRLTSNGYLSDVVRIWQFRAPIGDVRQNALPVCATKPGEGTHIQAFGFGVDFDSQAKSEIALSTALNAPLSIGAASDPLAIRPLVLATPTATPTTNSNASNAGTSFSAKQMGMAVGLFLNEPSRSLAERLGLLFSNKNQLNISPYIMRMGGTSSQPGESGSPIFSVSMSGSNPFSSGFINPKDIAKWECLAGLVSREVASRKAGSDELEWDTFYTPLLSYSERSWSSVEIQRGVSLARTYSTLVGANIASVPLALTNRGEPSNATMDSSPLAGQTVVQKSLSGRHLNVNAETVFGANVFKSASPKEIIIESGAVVTSDSTSRPAILVPVGMGGILRIINKGKIIGKGGSPGGKGGNALVVRSPLLLANFGLIAGVGGGGGIGGGGGSGGVGTVERGFAGSDGLNGWAGGDAGFGIDGYSLIYGRSMVNGKCQSYTPSNGDILGGWNSNPDAYTPYFCN